jgi:phosphatidylglycerophosphate synthase
MKSIPYILTYSRLVMAVFYILVSICKPLQNNFLIVSVLIVAILTDIFDGIIARRLKIATAQLRQLDSKVDTVFWLSLMYVLIVTQAAFVKANAMAIFILVASEILIQMIGYFRYNSSLALHTYAAKLWAVLLTITVCQLCVGTHASVWFKITFIWGLVTQLEIMAIIFKLNHFQTDVKSIFSLLGKKQSKYLTNGLIVLGVLILGLAWSYDLLDIKEKLIPLNDSNMTAGFLEMIM